MHKSSVGWSQKTEFQSAPGREAGRCSRAEEAALRRLAFQSAPGREAGRCTASLTFQPTTVPFQSAPGREAGRCHLRRRNFRLAGEVSIRARP